MNPRQRAAVHRVAGVLFVLNGVLVGLGLWKLLELLL